MSPHQQVCAAVRDWQQGTATADDVTGLALRLAGDEAGARDLIRAAVEWWQRLSVYRDVNGAPIRERAA